MDNSKAVLAAMEEAKLRVLEEIGLKAERYAKKLCPVGTVESTGIKGYRGGTLRNSITHRVDQELRGPVLSVGSNIPYSAYVELGTGPYFEPPPSWETFETEKGSGVGRSYVKPRPYIRPAIEDHREEYENIAKRELKRV